jgi:hypothetical protein
MKLTLFGLTIDVHSAKAEDSEKLPTVSLSRWLGGRPEPNLAELVTAAYKKMLPDEYRRFNAGKDLSWLRDLKESPSSVTNECV